ncbi:hypothetical protein TPHV1_310020 [Treponema phagedenis]|uniref:HIT domain-containing protein n=1 Tax=Treponema phagedenis TaxID=162 RepID=A0A0B7H0E1_TREPH|nr:HIT domain-containing protein [Treponema phagedenis]QSH95224.1 HIT domain-containing protein [Treponema phagedenis]CEM62391.1 hypothetical protein TPHV1_310020 [Treponema phagedenis]
MKKDCPFCFNNRKIFLAENGYSIKDMYFYEDENYSISPDLAPLVTGHLLVIPKNHYASFGELNNSEIIDSIKQNSKRLLGTSDLLYFEHGVVIEGEGGASIDHAHLHVLPRPTGMDENAIDHYIKTSGYIHSEKVAVTDDTLHSFYEKEQPYIFYEINRKRFAYAVNIIPHQFLRLMLQPFCTISYNWRETYKLYECKNNVLKTICFVNEVKK